MKEYYDDETFRVDEEYVEDIKETILIPPATEITAEITNANIVKSRDGFTWIIQVDLEVTEDNEWNGITLSYNVPMVTKALHASKAAWAKMSSVTEKDSNRRLQKFIKLYCNLADADYEDTFEKVNELLANTEDSLDSLIHRLFFEHYMTLNKGDIPKSKGFLSAINKVAKFYKKFDINKHNPLDSIKELEGKTVRVLIGKHNEFKGQKYQTIDDMELVSE